MVVAKHLESGECVCVFVCVCVRAYLRTHYVETRERREERERSYKMRERERPTWFMPALANRSVGSSCGMVDEVWT